jgi:hypothetical protein
MDSKFSSGSDKIIRDVFQIYGGTEGRPNTMGVTEFKHLCQETALLENMAVAADDVFAPFADEHGRMDIAGFISCMKHIASIKYNQVIPPPPPHSRPQRSQT